MADSHRDSDLKNKLASGEYILLDTKGKSEIWTRFKLISIKNSGASTGFVRCNDCSSFFSYDSVKSGTSHLRRHNCRDNSCHKLTSYFNPSQEGLVLCLDKKDKENVLEACVKMCCKDLRPFDIVSGKGFIDFAQTLVDIGTKHGNINVVDILPHPSTISRHVSEIADNLRNDILPVINEKIKQGCCSASTDMWTDDFRKKSFTSVTVHYFDDDWNLISKLLFTCDFPDERKTGVNIRKELIRRFSQFGLSNDAMDKLTFVTDRGSNIINALEPFQRLDCMAHIINTVLRNLFNVDYLKEKNRKVFETLIGVKSLVTFMKQSGLVNRLSKSVHQDSETRWNSKLKMLKSVYDLFDEISEVLQEKGEEHRLHDINTNVLYELIKFLEPFKEASLSLEKEKEVTLPFVLLWQKKLNSKCNINPGDEEFLTDIKKRCKELLKQKYSLRNEHKLATFLCPSFRQLRMLNESERDDVINLVKDEINGMQVQSDTTAEVSLPETETDTEEQATKRRRTENLFMEWQDKETVRTELNEIDVYCAMNESSTPNEINIWWKNNQTQLKKLSKIAQKILCIPATSASCERSFSAAGFLINERRTRLNPEVIDASLFLHNNL